MKAIRAYEVEDVAILMPADQRLDATDEDEEDKAKEKEGKTSCEERVSGSETDRSQGSNACEGLVGGKEKS